MSTKDNKSKLYLITDFVPNYHLSGMSISSKFGPRIHPVTKVEGKQHNGVDIPMNIGVPIYTPEMATVVKSGWHKFGGKQLLITFGGRYMYYFCHLSVHGFFEGEAIRRGSEIAWSGNTGLSTGPHLHFGIWDTKIKGWLNPVLIIDFVPKIS